MKSTDIISGSFDAAQWEAKDYQVPRFDIAAVARKTHEHPTRVHFSAGNISGLSRRPS